MRIALLLRAFLIYGLNLILIQVGSAYEDNPIKGLVDDTVGHMMTDSDTAMCQNELNKMMAQLLKEDKSNLLVEYFNLASLKLALKVVADGGANKNIENFIKTKMKNMDEADKHKIIKKVTALYNEYGKPIDQNTVAEIVDGLDDHSYYPKANRLSNEEHSVIMLAYKELDPCRSKALCIDQNDVAITWFMDEVSKKANKEVSQTSITNMLEMSVKVTNLVGGIELEDKEMKAHTEDDLEEKIRAKSNKINLKLENLKTSFIMQFEECESLIVGTCGVKSIQDATKSSMSDILSELDNNKIRRVPASNKLKLSEALTLNLNNSLTFKVEANKVNEKKQPSNYPSEINFPAELVSGEKGPNTCGGEPFKPDIDNISLFTFDPLRTLGNIKGYGSKGRKYNMMGSICEMIKLGPIQFHCYTFMKKLVVKRKTADAKVCCEDKVKWEPFVNLYAGISGGAEIKGYLGIPLLNKIGLNAELGLMGGISGGLTIGGGKVPEGCISKKCIQAAVRTSFYIGAYVDVGLKREEILDSTGVLMAGLNVKDKNLKSRKDSKNNSGFNLIGGELKLSLKPYITGRQCLYPSNALPPAELKYSIGSVWIHGTIEMGWMFWWDVYELAYKNDKEDSVSIPIF